ncbi:hypothetical protein [Teredinibacter sp. KSP-S5-2]|uniref:hypothetical protein n=1 Tax=Teredinibacter sp. KSP-S5-2 TaxID=3034506 RepID=UPI00293417B7|nr:hypothetical protein [Teredinibacter sp. KSP-S5-2]WNO10603.1 hypothetical protein P5V12_05390 [Teredinibacter sp. KSP-S5-2]
MTAHEAGGVKNPYDAIEQKIYSHAKAMGCEDYVDYDKASDWYYNTALLEEELMGFLDEYERQAFLNQF